MKMALKNSSANYFRKFKRLQLTFQVVHYTHRVIQMAVRLVVEEGLPYRPASWHLWRDHRVFVPFATMQNWAEAGGKKGPRADGRSVPRLGAGGLFRLCGGR